jgi:hypothetical protein
VSGGGLLKRSRLSSLRCRDRVHRFGGCYLKRTAHLLSDTNSPELSSPCHAWSMRGIRRRGHN